MGWFNVAILLALVAVGGLMVAVKQGYLVYRIVKLRIMKRRQAQTRAEAVALNAFEKVLKRQTAKLKCPSGHELKKVFRLPSGYRGKFQCEVCRKIISNLSQGLRRCQACSYDVCHDCGEKGVTLQYLQSQSPRKKAKRKGRSARVRFNMDDLAVMLGLQPAVEHDDNNDFWT